MLSLLTYNGFIVFFNEIINIQRFSQLENKANVNRYNTH